MTALIGAYEPGPGPGGLRALLPLAGATLVEHQVRRAVAGGAGQALLLVETVPPELAEMAGRLRHEGIPLGLVESISAAADALPADDPVLLIADACLPEIELIARLVAARAPTLAALPDTPDFADHERIDATSRWAGIALLDGHRVAETAAMIGGWDPVSTLLRCAVQEGAGRIDAAPMPPALMHDAERRDSAEAEIVTAARRPGRDWVERWIFGPIEEVALPPLLARRAEALPLALGSVVLALAGGLLACLSWPHTGLLALLLGGPLAAIAARIGRVRDRPVRRERSFAIVRVVGAGLAVAGLALRLWQASGQWGWALLGLALIGGMSATVRERRRVPDFAPLWLARTDGLVWAMLPFGIAGWWGSGLAALTLYVWACFALVQREAAAN